MLSAHGLWAGRDLYLATPAVTRGLGFSSLIRRTAPFSRLLRHTRGCGGSNLTRILMGQEVLMKLGINFIKILQTCEDLGENGSSTSSPAEKPPFLGVPSNVVYSFFLGIKWKLRMSRFRICMMSPWHPWAFCTIQDGVQDGHQFKQTSRTPLLLNIER
jgi:hypothetical protein